MIKRKIKDLARLLQSDEGCNRFCLAIVVWTILVTLISPRIYMIIDHYPYIECSFSEVFTTDTRLDIVTAPFTDMSDTEQVAAIVGWFTENIEYHNGSTTDRVWKGVLDTGRGNCRGQAELFYMLASKLGLDCSIYGIQFPNEINGHAICVVSLGDGSSMIVDTTAPLLATPDDYALLMTATYGGYTVLYPNFSKKRL